MCLASGGLPSLFLDDWLSILESLSGIDMGQEFRGVELSEPRLRHPEDPPDQGGGAPDDLESLGGSGAEPDGGKGTLDDVRRADVFPVGLGEGVEGDEATPVLREAVGGLGMPSP